MIEHSVKWDQRYLKLAEEVASWSKDPSTQVGAVIVRPDKTIASIGFNGFPRGVIDDSNRYNDRELKYKMIVHGEANAIVSAREPLHDCTIYTWPFPPCSNCAALIIQAGIARVVAPVPTPEQIVRWGDSFRIAKAMFFEANVALQTYAVA